MTLHKVIRLKSLRNRSYIIVRIYCRSFAKNVTISLKTLKSVYVKRVAKSKLWRVYSSNTEYAWLL